MIISAGPNELTHWGRVTHICVGYLTTIGSDNGLSPGRRQAITWTNVGILLIGPLGTNFNEMLIEIHTFSFKKIHLKMSSGKWRPFCLGLNVLKEEEISVQQSLPLLYIEAWWCTYFSVTWIVGSGNGLAPDWCQAITLTNEELFSVEPLGTNSMKFI